MSPRCLVDVACQHPAAPAIDHERLQHAVEIAVADDGVPLSSLSVLVVDETECVRLHQTHFEDPEPTDVMTFPDGSRDPETERVHLGDIAICADVARRVAGERSDDPHERERVAGEECILYVVHGLLHLLGFDDHDPEDRSVMWQRQRAVLAQVGIRMVDDG